VRHMEDFIKEITQWEDFDDDDQMAAKIGFNVQNIPPAKPTAAEG
jgi:hypothetical protein